MCIRDRYNLVESITIGACLLESFMPETTEKILAQLNAEKRSYEELDQFGLLSLIHIWSP